MTPQEKQRIWSARWKEKLKLDPVRYAAYVEKMRWRDRNRIRRTQKNRPSKGWNLNRIAVTAIEDKPKKVKLEKPHEYRAKTKTKGVLKERYHMNRKGRKVTATKLDKAHERREQRSEIDDLIRRLTGESPD